MQHIYLRMLIKTDMKDKTNHAGVSRLYSATFLERRYRYSQRDLKKKSVIILEALIKSKPPLCKG